MLQVIFYTKQNCPLCDDVRAQLWLLNQTYTFEIVERDIYTNDTWLMAYQLSIPVVEINGLQLDCEAISYQSLAQLLQENV